MFVLSCLEEIKNQSIHDYVLKETSNAKSELLLLEWTPPLCLRFVLYDMRLLNTFTIAV